MITLLRYGLTAFSRPQFFPGSYLPSRLCCFSIGGRFGWYVLTGTNSTADRHMEFLGRQFPSSQFGVSLFQISCRTLVASTLSRAISSLPKLRYFCGCCCCCCCFCCCLFKGVCACHMPSLSEGKRALPGGWRTANRALAAGLRLSAQPRSGTLGPDVFFCISWA